MSEFIRAFISYSIEDRLLAGCLRDELKRYGILPFIAHDDIQLSEEWLKRIESEILSCDAFFPILTNNFRRSKWTDHEVGIAVAHKKAIFPLNAELMPYGFLSRYQGSELKYRVNRRIFPDEEYCNIEDSSIFRIIDAIDYRKSLQTQFTNGLVQALKKINGFRRAEKIIKYLETKNLTAQQVNKIIEHAIENNQVHSAYGCIDFLNNIIQSSDFDRKNELRELLKN